MASITSISPASFDDGKPVTLTGSGFGSSQGQVLIGGVAQNVNTWSDTSITFTTVRGSQSLGACRVDVVGGGGTSYTPTVPIVTTQAELNSALEDATSGTVIGVQYNATPYTISRTQLRKNYGAGGLVICSHGGATAQFQYIDIENCVNLTLYGLEVYETDTATTRDGIVRIYDGSDTITVDNCKIHGPYNNPEGDYSAGYSFIAYGIQWKATASADQRNIEIKNCEIYDAARGVVLRCAGDYLRIIGNRIYRTYADTITLVPNGCASTQVNWNTLSQVFAKGTDSGNPHGDFIQFSATGATADWAGIEIIGNVMFGGATRALDAGQGIFLSDMPSGQYFTANVKGNVVLCGSYNGLVISQAKNCAVIGNTVGVKDMSASLGARLYVGSSTDGGGNVVKNNVAREYNLASATASNNHTISALSTAAFAALFDGTSFENTDTDTKAKTLAAYSMKVGGALDATVNIGAVGSGYVDFDAKTINGGME